MESYIPAQSYIYVYKIMVYPTLTSERKDHTPIRTRDGKLCGIGNCRKKKHVQRRQKHECAIHCFRLVGLPSIERRRVKRINYKPDEDDLDDT